MTKTCSQCKQSLPGTHFYAKGGGLFRSECKTCFNQYRKNNRHTDTEYRRRKRSQYVPPTIDEASFVVSECGGVVEPDTFSGVGERIVYFIRLGSMVKIGVSTNLDQRLEGLSLRKRHVLGVIAGGYELETYLHRVFREERDGDTEWFVYSDRIEEFLGRNTRGSSR